MSIRAIIWAVADERGVSPDEITGRGRTQKVAHARQEVMWRARQVLRPDGSPRYSFPFIGRELNRDHTTVVHGVAAHEARVSA
jgi:chromosomal replication initiation ATPase DnaA